MCINNDPKNYFKIDVQSVSFIKYGFHIVMFSSNVFVSYTNKLYSVVYTWRVGKAIYCCARAVQ